MRNMLILMYCAGSLLLFIYGCQSTMTEMSVGQKLYSAKCSSCHNLIAPERYSKERWAYYVDEHGPNLTAEEKKAILECLTE